MEPKLKHKDLGFGDEEEAGECSNIVKYCEHVEEKESNPSLKILALRESKTTNITFVEEKQTRAMSISTEENITTNLVGSNPMVQQYCAGMKKRRNQIPQHLR